MALITNPEIGKDVSAKATACIDDYYLIIYPDVPEFCSKGFVGYVGNESNPDIKIRIEINLQWMRESNFHSIAISYNRDNPHESQIIMTPQYFDQFRKTPWMLFDLWHEVGHCHTLHYFNVPTDENGSAKAARMEYFERGEVMPAEQAADIFGLYYTSREDALKALSYFIERRNTYTWEPREITEKAIQEFIRRKRILREIKSDETAREMLCRLCGKDNYLEI